MGGYVSRRRQPPAGVLPRVEGVPNLTIKGSTWCCNRDLESRVSIKHISGVDRVLESEGKEISAVDWSEQLPHHDRRQLHSCLGICEIEISPKLEPAIDFGESLGKQPEACSAYCWFQACSLCASIMCRLQPQTTGAGSGDHELLHLDNYSVAQGMRTVRRMKKPGHKVIECLVSKHPVVTSLRCRDFEKDEAFYDPGPDLPLQYRGSYNLEWIPLCALIVGFDERSWLIYHELAGSVFTVLKKEYTGVGEFILVPGLD